MAGARWIYFCFDPSLMGFCLWGAMERADLEALTSLMVLELDRPLHDGLVDVSEVEVFGPDLFEVLSGYVIDNASALSAIIRRTAMIRPRGLNGAIATGFFDSTVAPFDVAFFEDAVTALEHLGSPAPAARALALSRARAEAAGVSPLLRAVRTHLRQNLTAANPELAARAAGVSVRTLQRKLAETGTSFADELAEARVAAAAQMLETSDVSLTTIAFDVGCASPQHFSALFKRLRGVTPSQHRARHRGG